VPGIGKAIRSVRNLSRTRAAGCRGVGLPGSSCWIWGTSHPRRYYYGGGVKYITGGHWRPSVMIAGLLPAY